MGNNASHHGHGSNGSTPRSRGDSSPGQQPSSSGGGGAAGSSSLAPPSGSGAGGAASGSSSSRTRSQSMSTPLSSTFAPASIYASQGGSSSSRGGGGAAASTPASSAPTGPPTPPGLVDGGHLHPQGQYALRPFEHQDYSHPVVKDLILNKRLAPFYRGLEDHEESWGKEEVAKALKELRGGASSSSSSSKKLSEREFKEAAAYKGAVECPICFLYYPPNINTSRCCQQPICTECFVQIKRAEPTVTHLESEPAACPFCMELEFGVIYEVQNIVRSSELDDGADSSALIVGSPGSEDLVSDPRRNGEPTTRRKSVSSKSAEVVTIDRIRPDWEDKLNAVKAAAARRASRRIIMQRVGDRLVPVGYTSSRVGGALAGDMGPITTGAGGVVVDEESLAAALNGSAGGGGGGGTSGRSGRRSRRFGSTGGHGSSGGGGSQGAEDLEEMMMMEAMRLSLLEHEEQQRKEAEAKRKEEEQAKALMDGERAAGSSSATPPNGSSTASATGGRPRAPTVTFSEPPIPDRTSSSAARPTMGDLIDLGSMESIPQHQDTATTTVTAPTTTTSAGTPLPGQTATPVTTLGGMTSNAPAPTPAQSLPTSTTAAMPTSASVANDKTSFVSHRETTAAGAGGSGATATSEYAPLESDDER